MLPVCVKTPKGLEEVERRTYRLPMRTRQILIMIDGKRDYDALIAMFPENTLAGVVQQLIEGGFITPLHKPAPAVSNHPPAVTATAPRPSAFDEQRVKMARDVMISSLVTCAGAAAMSVVTRLESASRLEQLHSLSLPWRDALATTSDGRRQLPELQTRLAVIDPGFATLLQPASASASDRVPGSEFERLTKARNFMINTLDTFVGIAASSLIERVERCPNIDQLRQLYVEWRETMALTSAGRKRLPELDQELAALVK